MALNQTVLYDLIKKHIVCLSVWLSALIPLECILFPPWMHLPSLNASSPLECLLKPEGPALTARGGHEASRTKWYLVLLSMFYKKHWAECAFFVQICSSISRIIKYTKQIYHAFTPLRIWILDRRKVDNSNSLIQQDY